MIRKIKVAAKDFCKERDTYAELDCIPLKHIQHAKHETFYNSVLPYLYDSSKCAITYANPNRYTHYIINAETILLLTYEKPEEPKPRVPEKKHETFEQLVNRLAPSRYPNLAERYS